MEDDYCKYTFLKEKNKWISKWGMGGMYSGQSAEIFKHWNYSVWYIGGYMSSNICPNP
jgi:hypothetical protein